tara:strand:- start:5381 stop:5791 length:411 start_codon:yes stop_codon:yes gene_type:complete
MNQMSKSILYASIVLNGILLMVLAGVVPFLLYLSVIINLVLIWFSIKCIKNINDIEEDMDDIMSKTDDFTEHLENVHEMEMFYGDETLQSMIEHSKQLINDYIDLQAKYFDVDVTIEEDEYDTIETEEETPTQAQE